MEGILETPASTTDIRASARAELVAAARRGDRDAFAILVEPELANALGAARILLHSGSDAADAVQDALLSAWRALDSLRDPEAFPAWFRRHVVRAAIRIGRRPHVVELDVIDQDTAEHALNNLIDRVRETTIAFPLSRFRPTDEATNAAVYAYASRGSYRAAVVIHSVTSDGNGPWFIADAASCPASELGDLNTGVDLGDWRDASRSPVPAEVIMDGRTAITASS